MQSNTTPIASLFFLLLLILFSVTGVLGQDNTIYDTDAGVGNTGNPVSLFGWSIGRNNQGSFSSLFGALQDTTNGNEGQSLTLFGAQYKVDNSGDNNTFIGSTSFTFNTTGKDNVGFGSNSGRTNSTGEDNVYLGSAVGYNENQGEENTYVNNIRVLDLDEVKSGIENIFFGKLAGEGSYDCKRNIGIGYGALQSVRNSSNNIGIGYLAGPGGLNGDFNIFIGDAAGLSANGENNVMIGEGAGFLADESERNVMIGRNAGYYNRAGDNSVLLGEQAGFYLNGNNNIAIGNRAGAECPAQNSCMGGVIVHAKLFISTTRTSTPLLSADFQSNHVVVNGSFEVMGGIDPRSDRNMKNHISTVDTKTILEKVNELPILKWSYKSDRDIQHIGPMAQDFAEAFGLTDNDKVIHLVDSDGVKLLAIQALSKSFDEIHILQQERHDQLAVLEDVTRDIETKRIEIIRKLSQLFPE